MKKSIILAGALIVATAVAGHALPGENYCKVKGKVDELKKANKVAILAFNANTVITGSSGMGSLVSGAVAAAKGTQSGKMALDQKFVDETYDLFEAALKNEGYDIVPLEKVLASKAYQEATEVKLPTTLDAKGLKSLNTKKSMKQIAVEVGADRLVCMTSGHNMSSKISLLGDIAGKVAGQASVLMLVFDPDGKRVLMVDAKQTSDTLSQQVGGGFQDPGKILPMFREADKKLTSVVAAELSRK